jgi:heme A synthase
MIFFAGIYYGAMYGGSTTSILLNTPGEAGSMVTAMEGNKMAKNGRAGAALATAAIGSFVAGTIATVLVTLFAPLVAAFAIKLGPPEYFMLQPWWDNFLHNMATVQFNHRLIAWALFLLIPILWWAVRQVNSREARLASALLLAMLGAQLALGIGTLLLQVPVALGAAHQAGALVLFGLSLWLAHALRRAGS